MKDQAILRKIHLMTKWKHLIESDAKYRALLRAWQASNAPRDAHKAIREGLRAGMEAWDLIADGFVDRDVFDVMWPMHKYIEVWDNGGYTMDRYAIRIHDKVFTMGNMPVSPTGVNTYHGKVKKQVPWPPGSSVQWHGGGRLGWRRLRTIHDQLVVAITRRLRPDD